MPPLPLHEALYKRRKSSSMKHKLYNALKLAAILCVVCINLILFLALASHHEATSSRHHTTTSAYKASTTPSSSLLNDQDRHALLHQMVLNMQSDPTSTRRFKAMSPDDVISKLDEIMDEQAILKLQQLGTAAPDPVSALGMDKASFCKLAALKYNHINNIKNNAQEEVEFHAPVVTFPPTTTSIIVTTYFNSRVDPLRCYKHPLGHMAADNWAYLEHWWLSVFRSGLSAIIFHESLSQEFTAKLTTEKIKFQQVTLAHHTWSLCDERWAVYSKWLTTPAAQYIEYTLQMDLSDTVVARDPFSLFEQGLDVSVPSERDDERRGLEEDLAVQKGTDIQNQQHIKDQGSVNGGNIKGGGDSHRQRHPDLWVNVQRATDWIQTNYNECYGTNNTALLPGGTRGMAYNAGVVGGRKEAFLDLANAIVAEFDEMYSHPDRAIWNCDMSALHKILTSGKFLNKHSLFAGGHPFCAGGVKCWGHGVCDYRIYHK